MLLIARLAYRPYQWRAITKLPTGITYHLRNHYQPLTTKPANRPANSASSSKAVNPSSKPSTSPVQKPSTHLQAPPPTQLKPLKLVPEILPPPKPYVGTKNLETAPVKPGDTYPTQLLVYHAGKGLINIIAFCKLTSILLFIFTAFIIAPQYYYSPYEPLWMVPASLLFGSVPLVMMIFTTYPLTVYAHLNLPSLARLSKDKLKRYIANLPPTATMDMTTLRWLSPRITRLRVSELYIPQTGVAGRVAGAMSLRRHVPKEVKNARKWYHWRPVNGFMVLGSSGKVPEAYIWPELMAVARKTWLAEEEKKGEAAKPPQTARLIKRETQGRLGR